MKLLEKKDLELVKPKFRPHVLAAWKRGEGVPYGVIYLSEGSVTRKDILRCKELIKQKI
jgi:hypothetical protein